MSKAGMEVTDENVTSRSTQEPKNENVMSQVLSSNINAFVTNDAQALSSVMENASSALSKPSVLTKPSIMCRICLMNEDFERLLTPCFCKGTTAYVHRDCLETWLSRSGLSHCELCLYHFPTANHLRYGMWESMRIWFSHPSHRALLQADILLCMLLSIITFGLVAVSMFSMYYLTSSSSRVQHNGVSRYWTETAIGVFLGIVLFAFVLNTFVVIRANIIPWFRWWRRSREIQLVIRDNNGSVGV